MSTSINLVDIQNLILGLSFGLEQKDLSPDMMKCAKGEQPMMVDIAETIQCLEEKTLAGLEEAFSHLTQAYVDYQAAMSGCTAQSTDMTQLQNDIQTIAANLQDKSNAAAFIENIMKNYAAVQTDISSAKDAYTKGDWKTAGTAIGDFSRLVLLRVNNYSTKSSLSFFEGNDLLLFVEGFADGLTNKDIEDPLETCWKDASLTINDLSTAIADFKQNTKSSILAGLKALSEAQKEIEDAISPCVATQQDLKILVTDIETVVEEIQTKTIVVTVGKNILVNGKDIIKEVFALVQAAEKSDQKNIGLNLGDIIRQILLGNQKE